MGLIRVGSGAVTNALVDLLRASADVLAKFAESRAPGKLAWDGRAYEASDCSVADVQAAKWWGILTALVGLLGAQSGALTSQQKICLDHLLFGGMGSFGDFALDPEVLGREAEGGNRELDHLRRELFEEFQRL